MFKSRSKIRMEIKAVIIEDEALGRATLRNYVTKYCPDVRLLAEAENIIEGRKIIDQHNPDLVFLDIEMPYGTGFDLLEQFDELPFQVIFITAYSQYAIQALNLSAAYYILKPISIEELEMAVQKVADRMNEESPMQFKEALLDNLRDKQQQKIVIPTMDGFELMLVKDIIRVEAADNYARIIGRDQTILVSKTLKHFSDLLEPLKFMRVHKSHLINVNEVSRFKKGKPAMIELSNGDSVPLSAGRRDEFMRQFV